MPSWKENPLINEVHLTDWFCYIKDVIIQFWRNLHISNLVFYSAWRCNRPWLLFLCLLNWCKVTLESKVLRAYSHRFFSSDWVHQLQVNITLRQFKSKSIATLIFKLCFRLFHQWNFPSWKRNKTQVVGPGYDYLRLAMIKTRVCSGRHCCTSCLLVCRVLLLEPSTRGHLAFYV